MARRNASPENTLTASPCDRWLKEQGFSMSRVESKAVYSSAAGRYLYGQAEAGMADRIGCAPDGTGVFIEYKAPGKISTLKDHQRAWLIEKIERGAFAVVTDSVIDLNRKWVTFTGMRIEGAHKAWLKTQLPKPRQARLRSVGLNERS